MPNFIEEPLHDPFDAHACSGVFLEATFEAKDKGFASIPESQRTWLEIEFGLSTGEAAALVYLAKKRVDALPDELEMLNLAIGDIG